MTCDAELGVRDRGCCTAVGNSIGAGLVMTFGDLQSAGGSHLHAPVVRLVATVGTVAPVVGLVVGARVEVEMKVEMAGYLRGQ